MPVQIEQRFPRCQRCGRMIALNGPRIEALAADGKQIVFCSEICRDEYEALVGLLDRGAWRSKGPAGRAGA
jgi:hypothetical protein